MPRLSLLVLPPVLLLLSGCSGGSSGGVAGGISCSGADRNVLCLENCSLGCSSTGCQVTEIAQNENIVLRFSTEVDPHSVNNSSIQFRTAAGLEPVGEFLVNGSVVEFVPQVLVVGGESFFGFRGGETYSMTLPGGIGEPNAVRSTSGDPFKSTLSCAVHVTRGIVDLNGAPPRATLVSPATTRDVARDAVIQLEFNELLDITPFLGAAGATSPVVFSVRRTHEVNGRRECRPQSQPSVLAGAPDVALVPSRNVTVVTFQPSTPLPGNSCVEITVTERVRDLAQVAAEPQLFQYITEAAALVEREIVEDFVGDLNLDRDASAGTWANGLGRFGPIGGDGRHGRFDVNLGTLSSLPGGITLCTINTDNTIVPERNTTTGAPIAVTDGRFFFDEMVVPSNVRVKFVGNAAPQISVRGRLELQGVIDVEGEDRPLFDIASSTTTLVAGQFGGAAGVFGGNGGQGGDQAPGTTVATAVNTGRNGQDCRVPGGHAFAGTVAGTGGRGSLVFPINGLSSSLIFPLNVTFAFSAQAGPGGGGGGLFAPGGNGRVVSNNMPEPPGSLLGPPGVPPRRDFMGPNSLLPVMSSAFVASVLKIQNAAANPTATAIAFSAASATSIRVGEITGTWAANDPVFAVLASGTLLVTTATGGATALFSGKSLPVLPVPAGAVSSTHFLIGGAGGGGGGSHSVFALGGPSAASVAAVRWAAGAGGGGGGGAISLRAGHLLQVASAARILASGGSCGVSPLTPAPAAQACPGGGGSGGSVLLQGGSTVDVRGLIDVSGGNRGRLSRQAQQAPPAGATVHTEGGDGSRGFVRVEGPTVVPFGELNLLPAASADNVGLLTELDDRTGFRSTFRSTDQPFGPEFVRYEIRALVDGQPVLFSDDPAVGPPARAAVAPIDALFQAATIDLVTGQVDPDSVRDWRQTVGSFGAGASIADDALNAVRFQIVIDRIFGQTVEIVGVRIVFRV